MTASEFELEDPLQVRNRHLQLVHWMHQQQKLIQIGSWHHRKAFPPFSCMVLCQLYKNCIKVFL